MLVSITAIVCGIIFGEAIALLVGTMFISLKATKWLTRKNIFFLILDIITSLLILVSLPELHYVSPSIFLLALAVAIGTHTYRTIQYFNKERPKFCDNQPLFIVNNIKLAGLIAILVIALI